MMKKLLLLGILVASWASLAAAQTDDYHKNEFFAGYSYNRFSDSDSEGEHGLEVAYVRNVSNYVGIKGDFSAHFRRDDIGVLTQINSRSDVYRFMGGVQFKDNSKEGRVKPFAHLLAGGGALRSEVSGAGLNFSSSRGVFAVAVGGGLDIKANDRISVRVGQVDYAPFFRNGTGHAVRFSAGIVFH